MSSFSIVPSELSVSHPEQGDNNNMLVSNSRMKTILLFIDDIIQQNIPGYQNYYDSAMGTIASCTFFLSMPANKYRPSINPSKRTTIEI